MKGFGEYGRTEDKRALWSPRLSFRFFTAVVLGLAALGFLAPFDRALSTAGLRFGADEAFLAFMDQSLFKGQRFGAGDFPLLVHLLSFFLYALTYGPYAPAWLRSHRSALAFLWMGGALTGVGVHLFKGLMGRPRPHEVLEGLVAYRHWFDLHWPLQFAFLKGSFPSGHTASMMGLWGALLWFRHAQPQKVWAFRLSAGACLLLGTVMAFARVAQGAHWPTDTLASMGMAVSVSTLLVPPLLQREKGEEVGLFRHFELLLTGLAVWLVLGMGYLAVLAVFKGAT